MFINNVGIHIVMNYEVMNHDVLFDSLKYDVLLVYYVYEMYIKVDINRVLIMMLDS